jgi:hypothetical protein
MARRCVDRPYGYASVESYNAHVTNAVRELQSHSDITPEKAKFLPAAIEYYLEGLESDGLDLATVCTVDT